MEHFGAWTGWDMIHEPGLRTKLLGWYVLAFGLPDLHSHIRLRAISKYFEPSARTVEVGAGEGAMGVAFVQRTGSPCLLVPYSKLEAVTLKRRLAWIDSALHCSIVVADATTPFLKDRSVNQVLLIDVLEHVADDVAALRSIHSYLKIGGRLVLSVPTHVYPSYFGTEFDRQIGHVRHYEVSEITNLLTRNGFEVLICEYYTRRFAAILCRFWYRRLHRTGRLSTIVRLCTMPVLSILAWRDSVRSDGSDTMSASIVLVARRRS